MITKTTIREALATLGFLHETTDVMSKNVNGFRLAADFQRGQLIYPEVDGLVIHERQTTNFGSNENFVVFECVHRLLEKGYHPRHIELEPRWQVGRGSSGGRADIMVRRHDNSPVLLIECKTPGAEFDREWRLMLQSGGQLFSYAQQASELEFLTLYTSDLEAGQIRFTSHIVAHRDNEKLLLENPAFRSFASASSAEDRYKIWRDTYSLHYTTKGLFEPEIQPYQIGKDKYTLSDLVTISETDRKKKYNEFSTILRQHNVSGRENAFDKLVNLLLCKLVDEATNPNDLKFYWKGVAYDTEFDLLDRLQQLYQAGMAKFLGEDITYINENDVNNALRFVRKNPDATQRAVWNLFIQQKFYTNNDFSFIDVHNQQLFHQNTDVLIQILQMWQDIRLTTDGASFNQFLGDMFENFLDQGVKQSEGQFFTPMPLTRFIIKSLPLRDLVDATQEPPRVLDYACGAGHFLTEYAVQAGEILRSQTNDASVLASYHSSVYGIEKEYRLSKVAKVSTFMYGQPGINIVYGDALAHEHAAYPEISDHSFDLIVANPPYSVKGFLETLADSDLARYELTSTVEDKGRGTQSHIEAFFVERAKQLLRPGGIAAIVLPSSIFSNNDRPTRKARDLILEYFDLLSIVELGQGAFGSTGTSTVTVFLRRKEVKPDTLTHLESRIDEWFKGPDNDLRKQVFYGDSEILAAYAPYVGTTLEEYKSFLCGNPSESLLQSDLFEDYKSAFEKDKKTIARRKSKIYLELDDKARASADLRNFIEYVAVTEREKLLAFALAKSQEQPVLIVRSPNGTKDMKRFLGYSWSRAKGNEGIKMVRDAHGHHVTPMYDELDRANPTKINTYIAANFTGTLGPLPETLSKYATIANLEDLLDFGETTFDRSLSLTPRGPSITLDSKFPLQKLSTVASEINRGASPRPIDSYLTEDPSGIPWIKIGDVAPGAKYVESTSERITAAGATKSRAVKKGDFIVSNSMSAGRPYIVGIDGCIHDGWLVLSGIDPNISTDYLYYVLSDEFVQRQFRERSKGPVVKNLNINRVKTVKIPIADDITQKKLVAAAQVIETEIRTARESLSELDAAMLAQVTNAGTGRKVRLERIAANIQETLNPNTDDVPDRYVGLESIEPWTGKLSDLNDDGLDDALSLKRRFISHDVLYGKLRPRLNKVYLTEAPGMCSTELLVLRFKSIEAATFYSIYLRTTAFNELVIDTVTNTMPRTSWDKIKGLQVPNLDDTELAEWFEEIKHHRSQIAHLEEKIAQATARRANLVRTYL